MTKGKGAGDTKGEGAGEKRGSGQVRLKGGGGSWTTMYDFNIWAIICWILICRWRGYLYFVNPQWEVPIFCWRKSKSLYPSVMISEGSLIQTLCLKLWQNIFISLPVELQLIHITIFNLIPSWPTMPQMLS